MNMPAFPPDRLTTLDLDRIDRIADRFEEEVRRKSQLKIEDCLVEHPELRRPLLRELLVIDMELRGEPSADDALAEYLNRFPDEETLVRAVVSDASTRFDRNRVSTSRDRDQHGDVPTKIGRYVIRERIGRGGFGDVYLARDPDLDRLVAIKMPRTDLFTSQEDVEAFLSEARTAAQLKHPRLVAVYDVQTESGTPFVVQEYIDGTNLGMWVRDHDVSFSQAATIIQQVCEALGYLHQQGFVHADVKPANVLLDQGGNPHLADFGVAVHESNRSLRNGQVFGTPSAMAPEQVRGETHRFDGRTDLWAVGVMLYELLTHQPPFPSTTCEDTFHAILTQEPREPRQLDPSVPPELERICLKCLSKVRSERYSVAEQMIEDLAAWQRIQDNATSTIMDSSESTLAGHVARVLPVEVIPKGLRCFDQEDARFFPLLLPGPRNRDGQPVTLSKLKTRIESDDLEKTFSVGLVYGPSGCGKTSLVKAGVLPILNPDVLPVYVEATPDHTEAKILSLLAKSYPQVRAEGSLSKTLANLRTDGVAPFKKILLVIDQAEQWLHANPLLRRDEMVDALRQCDGVRIQAIVMIRAEFYVSVNRLFGELDIRLVEDENQFIVDLFSPAHACKTLLAFGRGYGLVDDPATEEQNQFVQRAVEELAKDGKVVCVRLALFAFMMRDRPWTTASLDRVGGVGGVGVRFLEETFQEHSASPLHRAHEPAIRAVLSALLPLAKTEIKGGARSISDLRRAAGYQQRVEQFRRVIDILDSDLRLITLVDIDEGEGNRDCEPKYQLTHDYLVPALRLWLLRCRLETRRGRAELRLNERAELWLEKPQVRHLPSSLEYLSIRLLTKKKTWSAGQQAMMSTAARFHGIRWASLALMLLVLASAGAFAFAKNRHDNWAYRTAAIVDSLNSSRGTILPPLETLDALPPEMVRRELNDQFRIASGERRIVLAYALAKCGEVHLDLFIDAIANMSPYEVDNLAVALAQQPKAAREQLHGLADAAEARGDLPLKARVAMLLLALDDPEVASGMCRLGPDLIERTVFLDECASWRVEPKHLARIVKAVQDEDLRSCLILIVGRKPVSEVNDSDREVWKELLEQLYRSEEDRVTHSACGFTLRQWQLPIPQVAPTTQEVGDHQWCENSVGMTMLLLPWDKPPGGRREDERAGSGTLPRPIWIADREVSRGQFEQFLRDSGQLTWSPPNMSLNPSESHPILGVSWYDAAQFCNWLSEHEGLAPVYSISESKVAFDGDSTLCVRWTIDEQADGYRLPSASEWEYACRAGTQTVFSHGDDYETIEAYAVLGVYTSATCGSLLPNGWGLFDVMGNAAEWCEEWQPPHGAIVRGSSYIYGAADAMSSDVNYLAPRSRHMDMGFRVVRTVSP